MDLIHRTDIGNVALLTLDDPSRRNALSVELCEQMVALLDAIEADEAIGAIVITGAGPAFCAGADLSQLGSSHEDGLRRIYEGFLRLASSPLPTVAAVNGAAVGAGMNLALAADVRMTSPAAKFDTRFLALGIHPGGGHTWLLQRLVGPQAARAMVLFGEVIGGEEATAFGLAWRCVPDAELVDTSVALAARAAAAPRELVLRTKATMADVAVLEHHEQAVERELVTQLWSMQQEAFAERLAAMQAKIATT